MIGKIKSDLREIFTIEREHGKALAIMAAFTAGIAASNISNNIQDEAADINSPAHYIEQP